MKSLFSLLSLGIFGQSAATQTPSTIEGKWRDHEKAVVVLIYQQNGKYFGKLIEADDPKQHEYIQENTVLVLQDFEYEEDNEFCCGTIYQPQLDRKLSGSLELSDPNTLEVTGRWGFLSGSRDWTRIVE